MQQVKGAYSLQDLAPLLQDSDGANPVIDRKIARCATGYLPSHHLPPHDLARHSRHSLHPRTPNGQRRVYHRLIHPLASAHFLKKHLCNLYVLLSNSNSFRPVSLLNAHAYFATSSGPMAPRTHH